MRLVKTPKEAWFPVPGDEDGAEILVKHLTPGELADIQDKLDAMEVVYHQDADGKMVPEMRAKRTRGDDRYAVIVACVRDWRNVLDEDGNALKCTDKNKIAVARMSDEFAVFVGECREKLAAQVAEAKEAAEKN